MKKGNVYTDELMRLAWGTDASFYHMVPQEVVRSESEEEVAEVLRRCFAEGRAVTFRAAGTSLSGQALSDSVLLVAGKNWEKWTFHPEDESITLQPGLVGARVNRILARYERRFGPDPASIGSCMVGGIVANNASGMSCGTRFNSDRLLLSARMVLSDGTVLDTGSEESRAAFRASHPDFLRAIETLRDEVLADAALRERIAYKYSIKNVTGLNLLPLITYTDPFDIIAHLLVGSEGTLAFLSEVTMKTLPIAPYKATAMIYFPDLPTAARAVVAMPRDLVSAAEMLDIRSLTAVDDPHLSPDLPQLTAVLTETQARTRAQLEDQIAAISQAMEPFGAEVRFTEDKAECAAYWALRAGIFPKVGGLRQKGTTCLIEDVAFHLEDLPEAVADLSALLDRHGYKDSCIYGHALAGNFHFIINQGFTSDDDVRRYDAVLHDVADLVVGKYDGSLKAEHGTGRNMAPFVEREWGSAAYAVMRRIKDLFDPKGILNPGVIFNEDPQCHLRGIKVLPSLASVAGRADCETLDKCIECGFCEVNCVSCGYALSSRTRIAVQREIARRMAAGEPWEALERAYHKPGSVLCAGDGLCSTSCPMGINVADLTHELRREGLSAGGAWLGAWVAEHFRGTKNVLRGGLALAQAGLAVPGVKTLIPPVPAPHRAKPIGHQPESPRKVVYFPSCINQTFGPGRGESIRPLTDEMAALLHKAGYEILYPAGMDGLCCGTIWESKGMPEVADRKLKELEKALWTASEQGKYPVLCDQSPCLHRMRKEIRSMHLYEPAEFILTFLADHLEFHPTDTPIAVHVTCSMRLMGLQDKILSLARRCSTQVFVPDEVGCCAFAGDKGFLQPQLNAYALRKLKPFLQDHLVREGYSNSRTCEIGLTENGGIPYRSIVYLVNACTTAK